MISFYIATWALASDEYGIHGSIFHYALIIALVGSAFLIFINLWMKGKLDMDESPKIQMMEEDDYDNRK